MVDIICGKTTHVFCCIGLFYVHCWFLNGFLERLNAVNLPIYSLKAIVLLGLKITQT